MAISSIGSSALSALTLGNQRSSSAEKAQKMLKDLDADQDGSVSKAEFLAGAERMKAQASTAQAANAPKPPSGAGAPTRPSADQLFASADQNGDQSLSVDELSSMLAAGEAHAKAAHSGKPGGAGAAGGPPPAGGGGGPRGGAGAGKSTSSSSESSSTSSSSSTDPADTNKDGVVSAAEKLIYNLTHSASSSTTSSSSATQTSTTDS